MTSFWWGASRVVLSVAICESVSTNLCFLTIVFGIASFGVYSFSIICRFSVSVCFLAISDPFFGWLSSSVASPLLTGACSVSGFFGL